jgi:hypothetical protein
MDFHMKLLTAILLCALAISPNLVANCPVASMPLTECLQFHIKNHRAPNDATDAFKPLSYCEFMKFKDNGDLKASEVDELITFAQQNGNPVLFKPVDELQLPKPEQYSLNFLWINKNKVTVPGHIIGQNHDLLKDKIIEPVKDWQTKQPEAWINIWYDGNMLVDEDEAIKNTIKILINNQIDVTKISLKNLRSIPLVQNNKNLFDEAREVYLRVDLAKAFIADYVLQKENLLYAVNIDSDIVSITRQQLFDTKTMEQLNDMGYVMGKANAVNSWENSFIILAKNNDVKSIDTHKEVVIERAIESANSVLLGKEEPTAGALFDRYYQNRGVPGFRERMVENFEDKEWNKLVAPFDYNEEGPEPEGYPNFNKFRKGFKAKLRTRVLEKDMIFPPMQSSNYKSPGYSPEQIIKLKEALVGVADCK